MPANNVVNDDDGDDIVCPLNLVHILSTTYAYYIPNINLLIIIWIIQLLQS